MSIHLKKPEQKTCLAKSPWSRAFSLIELLLVIGMAAGIFVLSAPFALKLYHTQLVEDTRSNLIDTLQRARNSSILQKGDSSYGVALSEGGEDYILFQGENYASREESLDEVFSVISEIDISDFSEIIFSKMSGLPSATGTISINYGSIYRGVLIEESGTISKIDIVDGEETIEAVENQYSVIYNGNGNTGGTVPTDSTLYSSGQSVTVLNNTGSLTKTNNSFAGWSGSINGEVIDLTVGSTFAMGGTNVTLYANWIELPAAPLIGTAVAGNALARVAFTTPPVTAESPITGYIVTSSPGGITATGASSPITVSGLTNGVSYTFTVSAVNVAGTSSASSASNAVTPLNSCLATGGTVENVGNDTIHTFTGNGTLTVNGSCNARVLIVAGGGSAGGSKTGVAFGGYGGAGGILEGELDIAMGTYSVTVGNGGVGVPQLTKGNSGGNSSLGNHIALGGGAGGGVVNTTDKNGSNGGSGGGGAGQYSGAAGLKTQVNSSTLYGYGGNGAAGTATHTPGGGGGAGGDAVDGVGGSGRMSNITGDEVTYGASGCAGSIDCSSNTGDGATPNADASTSPAGGSGIVIIRYSNVLSAPSAPTIGSATLNDSSVSVSFSPSISNGGSPITTYTVTSSPGGLTANGTSSPITISGLTNGVAYTFTVSATNAIGTSNSSASTNEITMTNSCLATGGTVSTSSGYTFHTFTSSGSLVVSKACNAQVLVVAGGGGGGGGGAPGGGGGAGGLTYDDSFSLTTGTKTVTIGNGGSEGNSGQNSVFSTITTIGGGRGASYRTSVAAATGGSGGGGGYYNATGASGNAGQGNIGGNAKGTVAAGSPYYESGGGGGAGGAGQNWSALKSGDGGVGLQYSQFASVGGSPAGWFAGGGGGPSTDQGAAAGVGGNGGGGDGNKDGGQNGTANTGGGGGAAHTGVGGTGGSGIVIVRYPTNITVPDAPTIGTATAGNATSSVTFTAPAFDGGTAITGYTVTSSPGGVTATGASSPIIVTGLTNGTAYTFTVTATNAQGTGGSSSASNEVTPTNVFACGGDITDSRDSKSYSTVLIGTQCWMQENLNVGTMVSGPVTQTNDLNIEKYCYNNLESNCTTYGGLYQWDEMMGYVTTAGAQGICPTGWHVPTDAEYKTLVEGQATPGCESSTGFQCAPAGSHLSDFTLNHDNSSGFTALMAGYRNTNGLFAGINSYTYIRTSVENGTSAWNRYVDVDSAAVYRGSDGKAFGFPVRCLKN